MVLNWEFFLCHKSFQYSLWATLRLDRVGFQRRANNRRVAHRNDVLGGIESGKYRRQSLLFHSRNPIAAPVRNLVCELHTGDAQETNFLLLVE